RLPRVPSTPPFRSSTPSECVYTVAIDAMPWRSAVRATRRMFEVLYAPKYIFPFPPGSPHVEQNATPVGAIVGVNHLSGRTRGRGPSWFVFWGGCPTHVSWVPHAWFSPGRSMLISSLHAGPFSVSHSMAVCGSKANPKEFR